MVVLGFALFSIFILIVAVMAMVFVSFDERYAMTPIDPHATVEVRRINTNQIETVDSDGHIERWRRDS